MKIIRTRESKTKVRVKARDFELYYNHLASACAGLDWQGEGENHHDIIHLESNSFPDFEGIYHVITFRNTWYANENL